MFIKQFSRKFRILEATIGKNKITAFAIIYANSLNRNADERKNKRQRYPIQAPESISEKKEEQ